MEIVPCHDTRARAFTLFPEIPWRVTYVEDVLGEGKIEFCSSEIMSTQRLTKRKSDTIVFHVQCVSITEKVMCKSSAFLILFHGYGI